MGPYKLLQHVQNCCTHNISIVDVDVSIHAGIVASLDLSGTLVISSMNNGSFILNVQFDTKPLNVRISPLGLIVVVLDVHQEGKTSTKISVVDIGGRIIAENSIEGTVSTLSMINLKDSSSYIAIATTNKYIVILDVINLRIKSRGPLMDVVQEIEYSDNDEKLYLLMNNGTLLGFNFIE